ncbi:multidrug efflux SMR transporter [Streptomyces sp. ID05-26A]|nr:multidrug efflux SMR transporter [Streptomyces sp. ID05-26A]
MKNLWNTCSGSRSKPPEAAVLYLYLAAAIVAEIAATVSLKLSEGFTRLWPSVIVVLGYAIAFTALSRALKLGMPVGVAYAVWSAIGVASVAIIGWKFLGETLNPTMVIGLVLIIGGVVTLELGRTH